MHLASVSFYDERHQVGGAQIPAKAFVKWCVILGIKCDYIAWHKLEDKTQLNKYDGVFFATPITNTILMQSKLTVPYVAMIHAEFDIAESNFEAMEGGKAVIMIDMDKEYWDYSRQLFWHPCTYPEYLLTVEDVHRMFGLTWQRQGLVYAARISTWKNALLLAGLSRYEPFRKNVGPIHVYGKANKNDYDYHIKLLDPVWTRHDELFSIENFGETEDRLSEFDLFWDVSGTPEYRLDIKRINLAAVEAMKFGVVPVVDKRSTHPKTHHYTIDINDIHRPRYMETTRKIMLSGVLGSHMSYTAVKQQVENIIEVLTS